MHRIRSLSLLVLCTVSSSVLAAESLSIAVEKTSGCGCCLAWVEYLEEAGFAVTAKDVDMGTLARSKMDAKLASDLWSCHTGRIGGYLIEGHVPVSDVKRLLEERPDAVGLTVPGMPLGSPGMPASEPEPYEVLLVKRDGTTEVYTRHEGVAQ